VNDVAVKLGTVVGVVFEPVGVLLLHAVATSAIDRTTIDPAKKGCSFELLMECPPLHDPKHLRSPSRSEPFTSRDASFPPRTIYCSEHVTGVTPTSMILD
jgi:hypothetical protein